MMQLPCDLCLMQLSLLTWVSNCCVLRPHQIQVYYTSLMHSMPYCGVLVSSYLEIGKETVGIALHLSEVVQFYDEANYAHTC